MKNKTMKIGVIGGGSWGSALAIHCSRIGMSVGLWVHEEELAKRMVDSRENDIYLPGVTLPPAR